jgi:uncharacterized protein YeaO (DUF488 family)
MANLHQYPVSGVWPSRVPGIAPIVALVVTAAGLSDDGDHTQKLFERGDSKMIRLKRAYDSASNDDGIRFLVERLWPRGVKKDALRLDAWLKDVAPSTELRKWFSHDPARWVGFQRRYRAELKAKPESVKPIIEAARRGRVTLVYSSHDTEHNNAVALKAYLVAKMTGRGTVRRAA